jgi:transposase-like protein
MGKIIEQPSDQSRLVWDQLEEWVRSQVQELIQTILEEEITQLLGRQKSERRQVVDAPPAYRNGHGKERKLTLRLCSGQTFYDGVKAYVGMRIRIPRVTLSGETSGALS